MQRPPWTSPSLRAWLKSSGTSSGTYRHVHITEVPTQRAAGLDALAGLSREAHADAQASLEQLFKPSLDPLDPVNAASPDALVYPDSLETSTLQGYLGETLAGLVAENYDLHGQPWTVPAFLFRGHTAAGESIDRARQLGTRPKKAPGRTGDDALAFRLDSSGRVEAWLFGEAKCTQTHQSGLIKTAHKQLSEQVWRPVSLGQLIEILKGRGAPGDAGWIAALEELQLRDEDSAPERFDLFVYVHGQAPKLAATWIPTDAPAPEYTGGKHLSAVEIRLDGVLAVLQHIFPRHQPAT